MTVECKACGNTDKEAFDIVAIGEIGKNAVLVVVCLECNTDQPLTDELARELEE